MGHSTIGSLPEELVLAIIGYLETAPPSEIKARQEPSLQLTSSPHTTLKNVCCVSKRWRRIGLPLLFKHTRLRLDSPLNVNSTCSSCGTWDPLLPDWGEPPAAGSARTDAQQHHVNLVKTISDHFTGLESSSSSVRKHQLPNTMAFARWAWTSSHRVQDFLTFLELETVAASVETFVLLADLMLPEHTTYAPRKPRLHKWRYIGAATLWQQVFSVIDPRRVTILAPPLELAGLANAAIDTSGDWAFSDMAFHSFELRQTSHHSTSRSTAEQEFEPLPKRNPGFALSSVIYARPWTHIAINEGSFLRAYGTYEYFERGPPSLVHSINQCFMPSSDTYLNTGVRMLPTVGSFTYTGIFPFANHADFRAMLPYLDELDCRFAPDPESGILDDKNRVGRAQLQDCWQELTSAYQAICSALATHNESFPNIKKFTCGDFRVSGIRNDLDDLFMPMCLPAWAEMEPGVFHRLSTSSVFITDNDNGGIEEINA